MSNTDLPRGLRPPQGGGKCYKGVENFLKRVAFNLGNTPSRTEVKIISCIPIDVSDLQQKIICLEKELEKAKCFDQPDGPSDRCINTLLCDNRYSGATDDAASCRALKMEKGNRLETSVTAKQKCKVGFLSPSPQESVESSSSRHFEEPYMPANRQADCYGDIMSYDTDLKAFTVGETKQQHQGRRGFFRKKKKAFRHKKYKNHYVYYAQMEQNPIRSVNAVKINKTRKNNIPEHSYMANVMDKQYKSENLGGNSSEISAFSSPICRDTLNLTAAHGTYESDICSCCHGTFHNIDNQPFVGNTPQVYRAENIHNGGGFYDSTFYDMVPVKEKPNKVKKPYEIMKKREQRPSVDIMCWPEDVRTKLRTYPMYSPFYVDYTAKLPRTRPYLKNGRKVIKRELITKNAARRKNIDRQINMEMSKSSCIDFGDVYPKVIRKKNERVDKVLRTDKNLTGTEVYKVDAECLTTATNNSECQTISSISNPKDSIQSSDDKTEETLNQIKTILQSVLHEVKTNSLSKKDATMQKGVSQGNVAGFLQANLAAPVPIHLPGALHSNTPAPVQGNKSRLLNYNWQRPEGIQGIPLNNTTEGLQSNVPMQGSRLLNSYTYSPYDIPPYLPSCSKQVNPNLYYYTQPPVKCFQNFPLIVQNQGQPDCASCFRYSAPGKHHSCKQATTTATNTGCMKVGHNKETQKLIKEIYKSMALTMGAVKKDNSSDYEPLHDLTSHIEKSMRTVIDKPTPVKEFKKVTNVVQAVSELFRKRDMPVSSESRNLIASKLGTPRGPQSRYGSRNTTTMTESKPISTDATVFSGLVTTTTTTDQDFRPRKDRFNSYVEQPKRRQPEPARPDKRTFQPRTQNKMAAVDISETTSSETETEETLVLQKTKQAVQPERKEKISLLSKMFRSVKLFKARERKNRDKIEPKAQDPSSEESSSDSDDYQTVYSQKIEHVPKHVPRVHNMSKRRTHSKISYKHAYPRDRSPEKVIRRPPYMEQEYRRHWNERLMFQNNPYGLNSQGYAGEPIQRYSPYYRTYEARAAIVEQPNIIPRYVPKNVQRVQTKQGNKPSNKTQPRITSKPIPWLKKHKVGTIRCGKHFRQLINDN